MPKYMHAVMSKDTNAAGLDTYIALNRLPTHAVEGGPSAGTTTRTVPRDITVHVLVCADKQDMNWTVVRKSSGGATNWNTQRALAAVAGACPLEPNKSRTLWGAR